MTDKDTEHKDTEYLSYIDMKIMDKPVCWACNGKRFVKIDGDVKGLGFCTGCGHIYILREPLLILKHEFRNAPEYIQNQVFSWMVKDLAKRNPDIKIALDPGANKDFNEIIESSYEIALKLDSIRGIVERKLWGKRITRPIPKRRHLKQ